MQQMTPTRIFRKTEAASYLVKVVGLVIAVGILFSLVISIF